MPLDVLRQRAAFPMQHFCVRQRLDQPTRLDLENAKVIEADNCHRGRKRKSGDYATSSSIGVDEDVDLKVQQPQPPLLKRLVAEAPLTGGMHNCELSEIHSRRGLDAIRFRWRLEDRLGERAASRGLRNRLE
jgi:hypothetical protein